MKRQFQLMCRYKKYEFCRYVGCLKLRESVCILKDRKCIYTAKQLHKLLEAKGFEIVKEDK